MKKNFKIIALLIIVAVMAAALSGCIDFSFGSEDIGRVGESTNPGGQSNTDFVIDDSVISIEEGVPPKTEGDTLADVVEKICDSVVEIRVETSSGTSAGSGVVISMTQNYTYIITCQHVVEGYRNRFASITVKLSNGDSLNAVYIGGVGDTDIAVIRTAKTENVSVAVIRDFDEAPLRLAEETIVIGNPLGTLGGTVTRGIVSSKAREVKIEGNTMTLIQTDASINSGNSGGAMFDSSGLLIGIVNAKASGEGIEGLGFAIPIDTAMPVALAVMQTSQTDSTYGGLGYVPGKFMLGILIETQSDYSYLISEVYDYGTLTGKVSKGQYIVSFNNKAFSATTTLSSCLKDVKVGDIVSFGIKTSKTAATTTLTVTIKQYVYGSNK